MTGFAPTSRFAIGEDDFLLDGEPFRILSGAIHYFRVHPDQWTDRIRAARQLGLNTVETYVAWNAHEPRRGEWDESDANDLGRFLDLVAAEGLYAIVRPGPYICAEWSNGGLPVWLTGTPGIRIRTSDPVYLAAVSGFLDRVNAIVAPRQIDRGGGVILVQIENEYGAYGDDADYLAELVRLTRDAGITVPLTTVDQPQPQMLRDGSIPGLHKTASFGSQSAARLRTLREHQPSGPLVCMEFWDGWFDWWGGPHHTTAATDAAAELDTLLTAGASVNLYMFHGGSNFGVTNGANDRGRYLPITTSYDYDAPLDESGHPTAKYWAFREVIARHAPVPDDAPAARTPAPSFEVTLRRAAALLHPVPPSETTAEPPTFDDLDTLEPLVRYEAHMPASVSAHPERVLSVDEVRDHAWVWVDGVRVGTISRSRQQRTLTIPAGSVLTLLVEDQGRVNYDHRLGEPKGIVGTVRVDGQPVTGWSARPVPIPLDRGAAPAAEPDEVIAGVAGPAVLTAEFSLAAADDLFLDMTGFSHGYVAVDGFLVGRYRADGPQQTLYIPAPVTTAGPHRLTVVELEGVEHPVVRFVDGPRLGHPE